MGLVTPLGLSGWETFRALLEGKTLPDRLEELPTNIATVDLVKAVGCVCVAQHSEIDPSLELAERAAREAVMEAGVEMKGLPTFFATSKGAVHAFARAADALRDGTLLREDAEFFNPYERGSSPKLMDHPLVGLMGPHHYLTYHLARRLKVLPMTHAVGACASSLSALHLAKNYLMNSSSEKDECLVLTAEAALMPQFIYSYKRLGVLAKATKEGYRQTPLDQNRGGFMLSEFGAAVVLRRLKDEEEPKAGEIELVDTALSAAAYDMVRSNPLMPELTHIAKEMFAGRKIDVVHPHATGTPDHDPAEVAAIDTALQATQAEGDDVMAYALKGALGHGLGAAGLVSLITAGLSLKTGKLPPMPWIENPLNLEDSPLKISAEAKEISRTGAHAMFAAGFGGHTAGALIQRH